MAETKNVSLSEMIEVIRHATYRVDAELNHLKRVDGEDARRGMVVVTVETSKDPAPRKGDKGKITQVGKGSLQLNVDWDRRRASVGLPPLGGGERPWGVHIEGTPLVQHGDKFYLSAAPTTKETAGVCGQIFETNYFDAADGTPLEQQASGIPHEQVVRLCRMKKDGITPLKGYEADGSKSPPFVVATHAEYRDWSLDKMNEITVTMGGVRYEYVK